MKKTLLALAFASAIAPGISHAANFQDLATVDFTANSSTASFQFFWEDLMSIKPNGSTRETNGRYWLTLTNSLTNELVLDNVKLGSLVTGDVGGVKSGSFLQSFNVTSGSSYTLNFTGKWKGPTAANWSTLATPSVSMLPVPEPESYAMFLAGLGIIGAIARRRNRA